MAADLAKLEKSLLEFVANIVRLGARAAELEGVDHMRHATARAPTVT